MVISFAKKRCAYASVFIVVVLALPDDRCASFYDEGKSISTDAMLSCWKSRQERVDSLKVQWREAREDKMDSASQIVTLLLGRNNKTRLTYAGNDGNSEAIWSFNGNRNYSFTASSGAKDWDRGIVWSDSVNDEIRNIQLRPWLVHYRPLNRPYPGFSEQNIKVRVPNTHLRGRPCAIIEVSYENDPIIGLYWIDIERDYTVIRYAETFKEQTTLELNIDYDFKTDEGWLPTSWNAAFADGSFSLSANRIDVEVNPALSPSAFEIDFLPGTIVFDRDEGARFLLKPNGEQRKITDSESVAGFTFSELLATESGELDPERRTQWPQWRIPLIIAIGLLTAGALCVHIWKLQLIKRARR